MRKVVPEGAMLIPDIASKVFAGQIFDVYQWPQTMFDGSTATFEMLRRPDTVEFIAIKDGKVLLVEEEQPGKPARLRIPGGRVDTGEDWLAAVQRECKEELGLVFQDWRLVYVEQPASKIEWFCAVFVATGLTEETPVEQDAGERITLRPYSFEEAKARIMDTTDSELAYLRPVFDRLTSLEELAVLPAYTGKTIDR